MLDKIDRVSKISHFDFIVAAINGVCIKVEQFIAENNDDSTSLNSFCSLEEISDNLQKFMCMAWYEINSIRFGNNALCAAASHGQIEIVKILLQTKGIDINAVNSSGNTPLMCAAKYGFPEVVYLLLQSGADVSLQNGLGETAEKQTCDKSIQLLLKIHDLENHLTHCIQQKQQLSEIICGDEETLQAIKDGLFRLITFSAVNDIALIDMHLPEQGDLSTISLLAYSMSNLLLSLGPDYTHAANAMTKAAAQMDQQFNPITYDSNSAEESFTPHVKNKKPAKPARAAFFKSPDTMPDDELPKLVKVQYDGHEMNKTLFEEAFALSDNQSGLSTFSH